MSSSLLSTATPDPGLPTVAIADGGPLLLPADQPQNLVEVLLHTAHRYPQTGMFHLQGGKRTDFQSYPALLDDAAQILGGLRASGLSPGKPVLFQFVNNRSFMACFWACVLGGFVPVPMSISPTYEQPHNILSKFTNTWKMLDRPLTVADDPLIPRLTAFAARESLEGFETRSIATLRAHPAADQWYPSRPGDPALFLLTSGSTGKPKAVVQTHGNLVAWVASTIQACRFSSEDISLNWMPLDHVGALVMCHLRDLAIGAKQFHAPTELVLRQPLTWLDWIDQHRATFTWAPNFAFGLINEHAEEIKQGHWDLSSMRFLLNGGEAIVSRTARRFLELLRVHGLPDTAMHPAWGMSETCSAATYSKHFSLASSSDQDVFVAVGSPIPGLSLRVVDSQDSPVPEGGIGRLQIRGISVTPGYYNNPEENRRAFTHDGWFNTGDLATITSGSVTITGRDKDVIIINGVNFYSHEIEGVVEELEGISASFTAACAVRIPDEDTDRVAVFFSPAPDAWGRQAELVNAIRAAVASKIGVVPDFIVPVAPDDIPKTSIGKIQRSQLRQLFEQGGFAEALRPRTGTPAALYHQVWKASPLPEAADLPAGSRFLVFQDPAGLGNELVLRLQAAGHECIGVSRGTHFARPAPRRFQINPAETENYTRLFAAISRESPPCTHLVFAWAYSPSPEANDWPAVATAQADAALPLLRLSRAWPAANGARSRWFIVTHRMQATDSEEIDFARSPLMGLVRTLPRELEGIDLVSVDFDRLDPANHVSTMLAILADPLPVSEVAVRNDRVLIPSLEPLISPQDNRTAAAFRPGGTYVISGGLGGIGRALARYLGHRYRARLLLLGQTPLVENAVSHSDQDLERLAAYEEISSSGGEAIYEWGDISDPEFVRIAVERALNRWPGSLDGIIHLAGLYHEAVLAQESDTEYLRLLRPKLGGALALHAVARSYPESLFLHFSSVLAYFGAFGVGAYAAANAGLDAFAKYQHLQGVQGLSTAWSLWSDTGMGRQGNSEAMRIQGYLTLEVSRAIDLLEEALRIGCPGTIAGLDPSHAALAGRHDRATSKKTAGIPGSAAYVAPHNELEAKLALWWQDLLGIPRVGVNDNFFELGGRSLLAAQLFSRIEKELSRSLPIASLFTHPTIAKLADVLAEDDSIAACYALAIQSNGSLPPFFCIPGVGSDAITFQELSQALGSSQPFYGLQARGLDATPIEGELCDVPAIAAGFVAAIRRVQPEGPYYIGGHCFGSLLAWELARQLTARGHRIGRLVLLDPTVSNVLTDNTLGRERLLYHWQKLRRTSLRDWGRFLVEKLRNYSRTAIARQRVSRSFEMAQSIHSRYELGSFSGPVTIFLADDSFFALAPERDPRRYYEKIAEDGVEYIHIPGNHHSILHGQDVVHLAEQLRSCLAEAQAGHPNITHPAQDTTAN